MGLVISDALGWLQLFLTIAIFARAILSWLPINRDGMIITILHGITEPIVMPFRKLIQRSPLGGPGMMIDFSVLITLIALRIITPILQSLAISLF
ncbi:MAG: YggT family protein [Defluviitaleaceae bacterium]|nr:YggT family protein [Defluviitaleaceae bacterium]